VEGASPTFSPPEPQIRLDKEIFGTASVLPTVSFSLAWLFCLPLHAVRHLGLALVILVFKNFFTSVNWLSPKVSLHYNNFSSTVGSSCTSARSERSPPDSSFASPPLHRMTFKFKSFSPGPRVSITLLSRRFLCVHGISIFQSLCVISKAQRGVPTEQTRFPLGSFW